MPEFYFIDLAVFEQEVFAFAKKNFEGNETIPDFFTRFPDRLESCLQVPLSSFNGKDLYDSFEKKVAILFYTLIKNHPFQNGNKRLAVSAFLFVISYNGYVLNSVTDDDLFELSKQVAESNSQDKSKSLQLIKDFLLKYQKHIGVDKAKEQLKTEVYSSYIKIFKQTLINEY